MDLSFAREIKSAVSMIDACNRYGIEVNRAGFARCCFHDERTASMKVYSGDRGYHCFGCGANGSVIDFVMNLFGLDFREACEKLNLDFALGLPIGKVPTLREIDRARQFEKKMNARKAEREKREKAYHDALDEYVRLDIQMRMYKPDENTEEIHPLYADALRNITKAEYLLEVAEGELYEFNRRNDK